MQEARDEYRSCRLVVAKARAHLRAVALGGAIYAIGGQLPATVGSASSTAVERYDAALNAWTRSPDLPGATDHAAVTASAASIFVFGGCGSVRRQL